MCDVRRAVPSIGAGRCFELVIWPGPEGLDTVLAAVLAIEDLTAVRGVLSIRFCVDDWPGPPVLGKAELSTRLAGVIGTVLVAALVIGLLIGD